MNTVQLKEIFTSLSVSQGEAVAWAIISAENSPREALAGFLRTKNVNAVSMAAVMDKSYSFISKILRGDLPLNTRRTGLFIAAGVPEVIFNGKRGEA